MRQGYVNWSRFPRVRGKNLVTGSISNLPLIDLIWNAVPRLLREVTAKSFGPVWQSTCAMQNETEVLHLRVQYAFVSVYPFKHQSSDVSWSTWHFAGGDRVCFPGNVVPAASLANLIPCSRFAPTDVAESRSSFVQCQRKHLGSSH